MSEIVLELEKDITYPDLKEKFESITREYALAVIESTDVGKDYPEAPENIRFLYEFVFAISCVIEENKIKNTARMTNDIFTIKELMISCAELGAAMALKTLQPKSDDLTKRQVFEKFGRAWLQDMERKGLIKGKRKGPAKNSPIYYSKAELMALKNAEKASRLGTFLNTNL
jgi:hypothetical protein